MTEVAVKDMFQSGEQPQYQIYGWNCVSIPLADCQLTEGLHHKAKRLDLFLHRPQQCCDMQNFWQDNFQGSEIL
jgi:hypothetical protein